MNFFDKINEFRKAISDVERSIYGGKESYLEIYERNLELEKEIAKRTSELDIANRRMLTLQHILEMMNSSKPLVSVLETIVNSLHGELGYLHSTIIRKLEDENGPFMSVIAQADNQIIKRVNSIIKIPMQMRRLAYLENSIYADSLNEKKIILTRDIEKALRGIIPDIEKDIADKVMQQECKANHLLQSRLHYE